MKQKLFTLFFALVASVGTIFAQSGTCGANLTWDLTDGVLTISGTGDMDNWKDNSGAPWWSYRDNIRSVTIGNSVTSIGYYAFMYCSSLTSVTIGNSVTSIGYYAFMDCRSLTSVTIGNSVTSIGEYAFGGCESLTSITIPNSVTSIGNQAFYFCESLTSVTIGNSVTSIGSSAFEGCKSLTSITIPNSVTSIGDMAFDECYSLRSPVYNAHVFAYMPKDYSGAYTIPNGIETIAGAAFEGCKSLTSITIPNGVTSIGDYAFKSTSLTSITIPNSVTSIGWEAFYWCESLTSVTIGNSVTSIGEYAFYQCINLKTIYDYAESPQAIHSSVFSRVNKSDCRLFVPLGSVYLYKTAYEWEGFAKILPIAAEETETTETKVTPDATSVDIAWPQVAGAYTYELVIKDKDGNIVCTLVFNSNGQLISIVFNAPARDNAPQHTQTAGFAFTVTGLNGGSTYSYSMTAKNEGGAILKVEEGSFTTKSPQGIEDIHVDSSKAIKVLNDGKVYILRDGKLFNVNGTQVK